MRLTIKLVAWFFLCVVLAVGVNGFHGVQGELERYESELAERHIVMGRVLRLAFSEVMDTDGEARAVSVLDYTDKHTRRVDIRWVHLEADAPAERRPHVALARLGALKNDQNVLEKDGATLRSYVPVHIEGRATTALEFSEPLDGEKAVVEHAVYRALRAVGTVALAVGFAAAVLGVVLVARPIRSLVNHARRVGRGDLSPAAVGGGTDELAELAREMNAMCSKLSDAQSAKLRALDELRHAERLSTVGKLASGLAHELGTPLNVITLRANAIAAGRAEAGRAREAAKSIAEQATRMTNLVRQLLDFARSKPAQRELVDVVDVVERAADLVGPVATKAKLRLDVRAASGVPKIRGDGGQLEQVITNLLMNAIHAMPTGGTVRLRTSTEVTTPPADHGGPSARYVAVAVEDEGTGIAPETLPHVFEPFFTTKEVGEGTGLGLAVCYGIVRDHGGWIDVKTSSTKGSVFSVFLPEAS
jgi:two-component system NtrC family sensor kinase